MATFEVQIFEVTPSKYLDTKDEVKELKKKIAQAIQEAEEISIFTPESVEKASFYIKSFSKLFKTAKQLNKDWTDPITQTKKDIDNFFKVLTGKAEETNAKLEKELSEHQAKQRIEAEEKRKAEQKRVEDEKLKLALEKENRGEKNVAIPIVPEVVIEQPKLKTYAGVSERRVATWKCIDFDLVPSKYKMLNEALIGAERRSAGVDSQTSTIPGIEFTVDYSLMKR